MQIQITGNDVEISDALKIFTEKKLQHIESHSKDILHIHITFHLDKMRQIGHAIMQLPHHIINAQAESEDMYKTVDLLSHKLLTQLTKYKEKLTAHR